MSFNGWNKFSLSDFVEINPAIKLKAGDEFSFVEMKDLDATKKFVSPSVKRKLTGGARFQNGDTLFARITPCLENGKICQVKNLENEVGFGSTEFLVFRGKENLSSTEFVYYLSRWNEVRNFAVQNMIGTSGRQRVSKEAFKNFELILPDLKVQHRIASILSSLDDAIELNQQTNKTLEEIAQTMFKEMCLSKGDELPEGWRIGKLGDEFNITMGQSPPGDSYNEEGNGTPFFQGRTDFGFRFPSQRIYTTQPKRYAKKLDTLVSVRAPVGDMNIASEDCCLGRGLAAVIHKERNSSFTYYFLNSLVQKFRMYEGTGTIFGSINKTDFETMECVIPTKKIIDEFEHICKPIDEDIFNNELENKTLAALRDLLLPRLMKGEIEINAKVHMAEVNNVGAPEV